MCGPFTSSTAPAGGSCRSSAAHKSGNRSRGGWQQSAGLAVAQRVVDQIEHPSGGGDFGDVAGRAAAAGDDPFFDFTHAGFALALHRFDRGPAVRSLPC